VIGHNEAEDRRNYFVTPTGITVVTRDYSLYESPVSSDFLQQQE
jgi:glucose-1-phosphate adenylyltransferase